MSGGDVSGGDVTPAGDGRPLRSPLDRLLRHLRLPESDVLGAVRAAWPTIVGADLGGLTELVTVRDGEVVVATRDPAIASELRWREREVVEGIRERGAAADRLTVRLSRPSRETDRGW